MDRHELQVPKLLVYHDLTQKGVIEPATAARRFAGQLDWMSAHGFTFATLDEFADGGLGGKDVVVTFDDAQRAFLDVALPVMAKRSVPSTLFAVSEFSGRSDARELFLSWDELHDCTRQGVTVGCHAASHVPLDEIGEESMRDEIARSTAAFKEAGFQPTTFAYPFGRYDEATKKTVAAAGYRIAVTVMKGGSDIFEVRRRLLTGSEGPQALRLVLSDGFFGMREAVRGVTPRRFLKQDQPIAKSRWGAAAFGLPDLGR